MPSDEAACAVHSPDIQTAPLIFSSPHSGRNYTDEFLQCVQLDLATLRKSEDSFVDKLFVGALELGAPLLTALVPRAFCDANREAWELDPGMFAEPRPQWVNTRSARALAGLGTIARVVADSQPIYRRKLTFEEAKHRVTTCWVPFHAELQRLLEATRAEFGVCLIVDCHSMPTIGVSEPIHFVIGDAHGTSCAARVVDALEASLLRLGYSVRRNAPYAGGYITRHYGRPRRGVHAIQLEIARRLYMDELSFQPNADFCTIRAHLSTVIAALAEVASCMR
jgi:N-formylglutamate amidohydrolase